MGSKTGRLGTNYAKVYSSWFDSLEEECPDCRGTGLDRDEIYDCKTCLGECVIVYESGQEIKSSEGLDSEPDQVYSVRTG